MSFNSSLSAHTGVRHGAASPVSLLKSMQTDKLRAHDSKTSKKKDQSGTSSPSQGNSGTHSPAGSAHATPTSSQTQLPINKPLPSNDNAAASTGQPAPSQPAQPGVPNSLAPGAQYMSGQPHLAQGAGNGLPGAVPGTPNRGGSSLAPSVVISPSAPVSIRVSHAATHQPRRGAFASWAPPPPLARRQ